MTPRARRFSTVALATALGACAEVEPCGEPVIPPSSGPVVFGGAQGSPCETNPALCGLETFSDPRNAASSRAVDVVFVGDGFQQDELEDFREHVTTLIDGVRADVLVGRRPALFNFHRIDVVSETSEVTNADRTDTALGGCLQRDLLGLSEDWFVDAFLRFDIALALATHVPEIDVLVTIVNTDLGRAHAALEVATDPDPIGWLNNGIVMNVTDDERTLTHELGHSLFGLGDEYSDTISGPPEPPMGVVSSLDSLASIPNLSFDAAGGKWSHLVEGAKVGGRRYGAGIYHPTDHCRMLAMSDERFCPVCEERIERVLEILDDPSSQDGPPLCGMTLAPSPDEATLEVQLVGFDLNGARVDRFTLDGSPLKDDPSRHCVCPEERPSWASGLGSIEYPATLTSTEAGCIVRCFDFKATVLQSFPRGSIRTSSLAEGRHDLFVRCVDALGATATATVPFDVTR